MLWAEAQNWTMQWYLAHRHSSSFTVAHKQPERFTATGATGHGTKAAPLPEVEMDFCWKSIDWKIVLCTSW